MNIIKAIFLYILSALHLSMPQAPVKSMPLPTFVPSLEATKTVEILPKYLIRTFFVPQAPEKNWDQPWQDACEEAALLTVKYYYNHQTPNTMQIVSDLQSIFSFETANGFTHDVNLEQMATVSASMLKLNPIILTNPSVVDFQKYLSADIPVIVPANGKILFKENSHFREGGPWYHNLVILGYDDNTQQFIVHDVGTQYGSYFHYSYQTLLDSIHDFPASAIKQDINQGAKKALVLLK